MCDDGPNLEDRDSRGYIGGLDSRSRFSVPSGGCLGSEVVLDGGGRERKSDNR